MNMNNIDVNVKAVTTPPDVTVQYKTIILKKRLVDGVNTLTQEMMSATNTKYVIKYDYILGEDIIVPENCILEFDGGSIDNGIIVGNNTIMIYDKPIDEVCSAERHGTFIYNTTIVDEEDLTSESGQLKFKDRPATDGMGRKILRKNMIDGMNTLTQSMINQTNTIYIIQYDFTLGEDITVPTNCVLEFDGGSISGEYTITYTDTVINANIINGILSTNVAGTIKNNIIYPEWFFTDNWKNAIQKAINVAKPNTEVTFTQESYNLVGTAGEKIIKAKNGVLLVSNRNSKIITSGNIAYTTIIGDADSYIDNFTIRGLWFDQTQDTNVVSPQNMCVKFENCSTTIVENCIFDAYGSNVICVNGFSCKYTFINNNIIRFFNMGSDYYDCSCIYTRVAFNNVNHNIVTGKADGGYMIGGIELHGFNSIATFNTIKYANIGFYIDNDIPTFAPYYSEDYYENGQIIAEGNKFSNVNVAFSLWSEICPPWATDEREYPPLHNVNIINNIGEDVKSVISSMDSTTSSWITTNAIKNIFICGNNFKGTSLNITSSTTQVDIANNTVINIDKSNIVEDVIVKNNIFKDYPKILIFNRNHYNNSQKQNIVFENNICINTLNFILSDNPENNIIYLLSVISCMHGDIELVNNCFYINKDSRLNPRIFTNVLGTSPNVIYKNNKVNFDCIAGIDYVKDLKSIYVKTVKDFKTFNLNEYVIKDDLTVTKCTQKGTTKANSITNAKFISNGYNNGQYLIADDISFIDVGDYINITNTTAYAGVYKIIAKCNNKLFIDRWSESGTSMTFDTETQVSNVTFRGYVLQ